MSAKIHVCVFSLMISLLVPTLGSAQIGTAKCVFEVTEPKAGQEVGSRVRVKGTAKLSPDYHLWVFARDENYRARQVWWPQDEGLVNPATGEWKVKASIGGSQDIGDEFDLAIAVFNRQQHLVLQQYLSDAIKAGDYQPIEMPAVACPPILQVVSKTSNK